MKLTAKKKMFALIAAVLLPALLFGGCAAAINDMAMEEEMTYSSSVSTDNGYAYDDMKGEADIEYEEMADEEVDFDEPESGVASDGMVGETTAERKIIMTAEYNIETKEYDNSYETLLEMTEKMGGYVSSSDYSGVSLERYGKSERYCHITIRIPAEKYKEYTNTLTEVGNILYSYETRDDVTGQYYDLQARIESLEVQEERLLELLEKAETIEDILSIEGQLSEVRYRIESYMTNFKILKDQVSYSTVTINLQEVIEYTPEPIKELSFGEKILRRLGNGWDAFVEFWEELVLVIVACLPFLVMLAVIVAVAVILGIKAGKSRKKKRAEAAEKLKTAEKTSEQ